MKLPCDLVVFVEVMALAHPRWGYRKLAVICRRYRKVSDRHVYRILKEANMLKKKKLRKQKLLESSKLYELLPQQPNQLWQMDVTYIYVNGYGWYYAVTVIDYYSRYLLACHFTTSYSSKEALIGLKKATDEAIRVHGKFKQIPFLVTDNGSSFISAKFKGGLGEAFRHVRIQYRTPQQLGLLERFHETLKNEEIYFEPYNSPWEASKRLEAYRVIYNNIRPHWALRNDKKKDPLTPRDVYCDGMHIKIPKWQGWAIGAKKKLDEMIEKEAA